MQEDQDNSVDGISGPSSPPAKKRRSENWHEEDKHKLKVLVWERVDIIENKNTDTKTNARKVAAWIEIQECFNSVALTQRTLKQLKGQWCVMKMAEKQKSKNERLERMRKSTNSPSSTEETVVSEPIVSAWLSNELKNDSIELDSDNSASASEKTDTPQKLEPKKPMARKESDIAAAIAETEIQCRRELHELQMANERQRQRNLLLKEKLILEKIRFYQNKFNEL